MALDKEAFTTQASETKTTTITTMAGEVTIRAINVGELERLQSLAQTPGTKSMRAKTAAMLIADEDGSRMFTDSEIPTLEKLNGQLIDEIIEAGLAFNGINTPSDELEKN